VVRSRGGAGLNSGMFKGSSHPRRWRTTTAGTRRSNAGRLWNAIGSFLGEKSDDAPKRKMPDPLVCASPRGAHGATLQAGSPERVFSQVCPLSGARFNAPMVAADGYTYDHAAIEAWLDKRGPVSPTTGEEMESSALIPNRVVGALRRRPAPQDTRARASRTRKVG